MNRINERAIKEAALAKDIFKELAATALFSGDGDREIQGAEFTLLASFSFHAANHFYDFEELNDDQRKRETISCGAELAASL